MGGVGQRSQSIGRQGVDKSRKSECKRLANPSIRAMLTYAIYLTSEGDHTHNFEEESEKWKIAGKASECGARQEKAGQSFTYGRSISRRNGAQQPATLPR